MVYFIVSEPDKSYAVKNNDAGVGEKFDLSSANLCSAITNTLSRSKTTTAWPAGAQVGAGLAEPGLTYSRPFV